LQPERRFTKLFDKVCNPETLREAWERVKRKGGAGGVDKVGVDAVVEYGEERFLREIQGAVRSETYRASDVRRVHIPKPGQPGKTRPLGIPTVSSNCVPAQK
jgi:retron-type reverse transcriptase